MERRDWWRQPPGKLRLGVSSCLLGRKVRWDGQHKRNDFLNDVLGPEVEWVPLCPEVDVGMGVPREPVRLRLGPEQAAASQLRMVGVNSGQDWTPRMQRHASRQARGLARENLCGYVFKKDSPSCGLFRVKVYRDRPTGGPPERSGQGLFAAAVTARLPALPVEEEGRLCDPGLRDNFIERLFVRWRLLALFAGRWRLGDLLAFHAAHKLALLAHDPNAYRHLGRFLAQAAQVPRQALRAQYESALMAAFERPATPGRTTNVLLHMAGYLRGRVDDDDRQELAAAIEAYRRGQMPLVVAVTLLRHHVRRAHIAYLRDQTFLTPHPTELLLRNHA